MCFFVSHANTVIRLLITIDAIIIIQQHLLYSSIAVMIQCVVVFARRFQFCCLLLRVHVMVICSVYCTMYMYVYAHTDNMYNVHVCMYVHVCMHTATH